MNLFSVLLFVSLTWSCKEESKSSENDIVAFSVELQIEDADINKTDAFVSAQVEPDVALNSIAPDIEVSEGATISPASGTAIDFSSDPVEYSVTAEDGSSRIWFVSVSNAPSSSAEILSFEAANSASAPEITDGEVTASVKSVVDLSSITPTITISAGATIIPESGATVDFSEGAVEYTVTAEDGTQKIWSVTVTRLLYSSTKVESYAIDEAVEEPILQSSASTILLMVAKGTDITAIVPTITVANGASLEPASGQPVDFSATGEVVYTVTAENGNTREWTVKLAYPPVHASDDGYRYVGRFNHTNPSLPRVWATGAYIQARFTGSYCTVIINDELLWGSSYNYYSISLNGGEPVRVKSTGSVNYINVDNNLPQGEHTITITKDTEAGMGYIEFVGLSVEALLPPPAQKERRLEFIGNSITCGAESDLSEFSCSEGNWFDRHNAYMSYGPIAARELDADYHVSSISGIGMIHSCCDMDYVMADSYSNLELNMGDTPWDFSKFTPDLVAITLGQNDGIQDSTQFCSAYVDFIETIRTNYPQAQILCLSSPMGNTQLTDMLRNYLGGIVSYMNAQGDHRVHSYIYSQSFNNGCGGHPDVNDHKQIGNELAPVIRSIMDW